MAIQTDTGGGSSTPYAKLIKPGDRLIGAFGGGMQRIRTNRETREELKKKDGKPSKEEVMYFVAMPGTRAQTGNVEKPETLAPIEAGAAVCFPVYGFTWGRIIEGRNNLPTYAGVPAGRTASGDVYEVTMTGWSAATDNPAGAQAAGFTVVENRIIMLTDEQHEQWALVQLRGGKQPIAGKNYDVTVRRPRPDEAQWEQQGDALFSSKPWERKDPALMMSGGPGPFDDAPAAGGIDRSQMF